MRPRRVDDSPTSSGFTIMSTSSRNDPSLAVDPDASASFVSCESVRDRLGERARKSKQFEGGQEDAAIGDSATLHTNTVAILRFRPTGTGACFRIKSVSPPHAGEAARMATNRRQQIQLSPDEQAAF